MFLTQCGEVRVFDVLGVVGLQTGGWNWFSAPANISGTWLRAQRGNFEVCVCVVLSKYHLNLFIFWSYVPIIRVAEP